MNLTESVVDLDVTAALARSGQCVFRFDRERGTLDWQSLDLGQVSRMLSGCRTMDALRARLDGGDLSRRREWLERPRTLTPFVATYRLKTAAQEREIWVEERLVRAATDGSGEVYGFLSDVTEREKHREKLVYLACFDELTGHFTRARLRTALAQALVESFRDDCSFCFAFIGLDHMVGINHAFGYDVADDVLRGVGARIYEMLGDTDTIGRVASSKFGVILRAPDPEVAEQRLRRIQRELRDNVISTNAGPVAVTASIGAVVLPEQAKTTQDAFAAAEDALTAAKSSGPCAFAFHTPNTADLIQRRRNLRAAEQLTLALREDRVQLAYQPVVCAQSLEPRFYECLARVYDKDGSLLPAGQFMPVAEKLGFVRLIDQRVMLLAMERLSVNPELRLSINLSPRSLFDESWHAAFDRATETHPEVANRLIVEITESAAIHDSSAAAEWIARIAAHGCTIALDDFGAGYTSFSHFKTIHFDLVKIDGSYVRDIADSEDNRAFVTTLTQLARHFGIEVVAEMVEDAPAVDVLRDIGVEFFQGYYFGRPEVLAPGKMPEVAGG